MYRFCQTTVQQVYIYIYIVTAFKSKNKAHLWIIGNTSIHHFHEVKPSLHQPLQCPVPKINLCKYHQHSIEVSSPHLGDIFNILAPLLISSLFIFPMRLRNRFCNYSLESSIPCPAPSAGRIGTSTPSS